MKKHIPKLTKRSVEAIRANGSDTVYWDGELTGFGLRVRASGRKKYVVQTRVRGRLRWFTIGPHGPVSVDDARARALEILALAKKGVDPRAGEAQPAVAPSVAALGRRFMEEYVPIYCKPGTAAQYRRMVNRFVNPAIGDLTVGEVQRKDIAALHYGMRDMPYQANRTLGMLSKMFALAEVWNWRPDGSNPCRHVRTYKEHRRERFLSERETARLGAVLRDLEEEMPSAVAAIRLLLLTGCRMSEIRDLRWEHGVKHSSGFNVSGGYESSRTKGSSAKPYDWFAEGGWTGKVSDMGATSLGVGYGASSDGMMGKAQQYWIAVNQNIDAAAADVYAGVAFDSGSVTHKSSPTNHQGYALTPATGEIDQTPIDYGSGPTATTYSYDPACGAGPDEANSPDAAAREAHANTTCSVDRDGVVIFLVGVRVKF